METIHYRQVLLLVSRGNVLADAVVEVSTRFVRDRAHQHPNT